MSKNRTADVEPHHGKITKFSRSSNTVVVFDMWIPAIQNQVKRYTNFCNTERSLILYVVWRYVRQHLQYKEETNDTFPLVPGSDLGR